MIQTAYAAGIMVMTMEAQFGELDYRSRRSAGLGEKDVILRVEDEKKGKDGGGGRCSRRNEVKEAIGGTFG